MSRTDSGIVYIVIADIVCLCVALGVLLKKKIR